MLSGHVHCRLAGCAALPAADFVDSGVARLHYAITAGSVLVCGKLG